MNTLPETDYYEALVRRDASYEGTFFVGVKTTGIFCRPTCPARKPKQQNCEFFETAKEALLASYRPCLRCKPLAYPGTVTSLAAWLLPSKRVLKSGSKMPTSGNWDLMPRPPGGSLRNGSG